MAAEVSTKCGLCSELYVDPRMLPCLHTFCGKCLKKKTEEQGSESSLKCPTCDKTTSLPDGGVNALPKDLRKSREARIAEYREKIRNLTADEVEVGCERCVEEDVAVAFCCQCSHLLCRHCSDDHARSKATRNHRLVRSPSSARTSQSEMVDVLEETDSVSDGGACAERRHSFEPEMVQIEPQMCSVHADELLKFFCETCGLLVCRDCTVVGHSGHKYDRMEKMVDNEKKKLDSLIKEAARTKERIEAAIASVKEVRNDFDAKKVSIDDSIASAFSLLEQSLRKRKEWLLAKSTELSGDKVDRLGRQITELERLKSDVVHATSIIHTAVESYSVVELLSVSSVLASRLKQLTSLLSQFSLSPCETKPPSVFVSLDAASVCSAVDEFGVITSGCCPGQSTASLQIQRAVVGRERVVVVTARDNDGKIYAHGGGKVRASLSASGASKELEVIDNDNGTYTVRFVPESCGEVSLAISLQGLAIKGSPFRVKVRKPRDYRSLMYYEKCISLSGTAWMVGVNDRREIFVGVGGAHCISVFDSEGYHLRSVGTKGSGRRQFFSPSGIAFHGDDMYVSEFFNHRVQKLSVLGDYKLTFGRHGSGEGELNGPRGLCFDPISKLLYVSDSGNNRVSVFRLDGTFAYHIAGDSDASLVDNPWGLAFDPLGRLHVVCYGARSVKIFTAEGRYLTQYGHGKTMMGPAGIAIDEEGYSFVSEYSGHQYRVIVFDKDHRVIRTVDNFASPSGLAMDDQGRLYVADHGNSRVLKY